MAISTKVRAVAYAVVVFVALHYSLTLGSNYLANHSSNFTTWQSWLILAAYVLYLVSGVIASMFSQEQFVMVGILAGVTSALSAVLLFGVGGEAVGVFLTLLWGLILGGLGGGLSAWFRKKAENAL